ncbi:hypothetical protein [Tumebacillus algifaecis]|uniref:hypothetical protein n=1 Tax=Tumebacillus algifaecis TaxID=1214604 RepID=UPI0012FE0125|nr:hypothetical protein [Tumebacillus algifaecis]
MKKVLATLLVCSSVFALSQFYSIESASDRNGEPLRSINIAADRNGEPLGTAKRG